LLIKSDKIVVLGEDPARLTHVVFFWRVRYEKIVPALMAWGVDLSSLHKMAMSGVISFSDKP
jgi:hypothetical protein